MLKAGVGLPPDAPDVLVVSNIFDVVWRGGAVLRAAAGEGL